MRKSFLLVLVLSHFFHVLTAQAQDNQDPETFGLEIVTEYKDRDQGFIDLTVDMEMILINSRGQESKRNLRAKFLEVNDDSIGEKRLLIFDNPRDVKGTVILTATAKTKSDDQWLYLPSVKRVKRITSNNKTGPFMGSEFSYEDLGSFELEKYTYKYIQKEKCELNDGQCYLVERFPLDKDSGYTRQIIWIDEEQYRLLKVEYYDRKDELLKTLNLSDYQQYNDKYWRAGSMVMDNIQTNKKTILNWSDYKFGVGISRNDFLPNRLSEFR